MLLGILAGIMIAIGCTCYATVQGAAGAVLFSVGLLTVCIFNLKLFTGQIWRFREGIIQWNNLLEYWIENLIGVAIVAFISLLLPQRFEIIEFCQKVCASRVSETIILTILTNIFIAIPCGILMTFAVKSKDDFCILLSVAAFILCGFRHCVADMYYVLLGATSWINWIGLISVTLGNVLGGILYRELPKERKQK